LAEYITVLTPSAYQPVSLSGTLTNFNLEVGFPLRCLQWLS
jgi:hypothetical protein